MKNKFLVVLADTDEQYVQTIQQRLLRDCNDSIELNLISDEDYFRTYFGELRKVGLLVVSERLYSPLLANQQIGFTIILCETPPDPAHTVSEEGVKEVYRYSRLKDLELEISSCIRATEEEQKNTRLVMVTSAEGGCGVTTTALAICANQASMHRRVLYLEISELQSVGCLLEDKRTMPESVCQQLAAGQSMAEPLPEMIGQEGFAYFRPFSQALCCYGIRQEQLGELATKIAERDEYDTIVLDVTAEFSPWKSKLMGQCDNVILLTQQNAMAAFKLTRFLKNIDIGTGGKYGIVCNRFDRSRPNALLEPGSAGISVAAYISERQPEELNSIQALLHVSDYALIANSLV